MQDNTVLSASAQKSCFSLEMILGVKSCWTSILSLCHPTPVHMYVYTCMLVYFYTGWLGGGAKDDECMIEVKCNIILPSSLSIAQRTLVAAHENIAGFPGVSCSFSSPTLRLVGVSLRL